MSQMLQVREPLIYRKAVLPLGRAVGRVVRSKLAFRQSCSLQNAGLANKIAMASFN
jgi:hypothetical protein